MHIDTHTYTHIHVQTHIHTYTHTYSENHRGAKGAINRETLFLRGEKENVTKDENIDLCIVVIVSKVIIFLYLLIYSITKHL